MTADQYPYARRLDLIEDLFGHEVRDPYRWLEDPDSEETCAWLRAEDDLFRAHEEELPGVAALAERILELTGTGHIGVPVWRGARQFFTRRLPGQEHAVLCTLDPERGPGDPEQGAGPAGADGTRTLIDPIAIDPSGRTTLDGWQPDKEGRSLAYQLSEGGSEESLLRVMDVETGELVDGPIDRCRYSRIAWLPGGKAFYYTRRLPPGEVPAGEAQFHRRVYLHRVGSPAEDDVLIFGAGRDKTTYYSAAVSRDGRWLTISAARGTEPRNDLWIADLTTSDLSAPDLKPVQVGADARTGARVGRDGRLYVYTDAGAPRGRLAVADPANPGPEGWQDLIASDAEAVLEGYAILDGERAARPVLLVVWTRHAISEITVHDLTTGTRTGTVPLPGPGTVGGISERPEGGHEAWFAYTDNTTPATVMRYDASADETQVWARPPGAVEAPAVTARQVAYRSKDGTEVRMLVVSGAGTGAGAAAGPAPGDPVRVRRLRHQPHPRLFARTSWRGRRRVASTPSPGCAAAARRARNGTGPGCWTAGRPSSTTSTPRRRSSSLTAGPRRSNWASTVARTGGCWSVPRSPSGPTCTRPRCAPRRCSTWCGTSSSAWARPGTPSTAPPPTPSNWGGCCRIRRITT